MLFAEGQTVGEAKVYGGEQATCRWSARRRSG